VFFKIQRTLSVGEYITDGEEVYYIMKFEIHFSHTFRSLECVLSIFKIIHVFKWF